MRYTVWYHCIVPVEVEAEDEYDAMDKAGMESPNMDRLEYMDYDPEVIPEDDDEDD